jgi:predicted phage-related endonuclease
VNTTDRTTHDVQQGTGDWLRLREGFDTASEAPAAQGVSRYVTRAELLRRKHTGVSPEPDAGTLGRFAAGHAAEAKARPLAEGIVGGELYPVTMTAIVDGLPLLASLDGLDLAGDICWETKLWNEELADCVRHNDLPEHYTVQMDQELLVSGASRCLFTCTDGTPERLVSCWYEADPGKFAALVAGWRQFRADLAAYVPPAAAAAAPVGKAPDTLPALRIEVTGMVTASNLAEFKQTALAAIRSVNRDLKTDADFADADKAVKWCADVEARLKAAKEHALSQTASIDELFKALDDIAAESKAVRLDLDKLVKRRKDEVREQAVTVAAAELARHVRALNAELAPMALRPVTADFAGSIKGLRSISSMQDALDTTLAGAKIAADQQARGIRANVAAFKAATGDDRALQALFADLGQLVHKAADDFAAVLDQRITKHRADEAAREAARQAAEAQRIAAAEQRAREEAEREAQARIAEQQRQELERQQRVQHEALAQNDGVEVLTLPAAPLLAQDERRPLSVALASKPDAPMRAREAVAAIRPAANEPATLTLGMICERLQFTVRADFLADVLHVSPAKVEGKRPGTYTESQFALICSQLRSHISAMGELYGQQRAA